MHRHRREFLRELTVIVGTTAAMAGGGAARGDEPPGAKPEPPVDPSVKAEVDARMGLVVARFGDRLDPKARERVRAQVERQVRRDRSLRQFKLENGDGPFPVFTPFRAGLEENGSS
jgi:hypothetical protein